MISREDETEILRLHSAECWPVGTIARQLGIHHETVERVLRQSGLPSRVTYSRPSMIAPYVPFILTAMKEFPDLRASRLYQMVRARGYRGRPDHFRALIAQYRPRPVAEAYLRLRTLPGEQAQCDWGHFGKMAVGRALRPLMAFVIVLSYSRYIFLRFYLGSTMSAFLDGHVCAFSFFHGVPRACLYDNLRSAVFERMPLPRRPDAIRFNPTFLELPAWYHFKPVPVNIRRGNEKGRVEKAIRYVRDNFFPARCYTDLADLNTQAMQWCTTVAADRPCPEDPARSVRECYEAERPCLLALPDEAFPAEERVPVTTHKTPYVRFDLNDYSVPHTHVQRTLEVLATSETVRIVDGAEVIATHRRSFDRHEQVEDPKHIQELEARKRAAREHRAIDRLHYAAPSAARLFELAAERGVHLGSLTRGLTDLLDTHGALALEKAIQAALGEDATHLAAVRHFIDLQQAQHGQCPPLPVTLPDDPRVRDLAVRTHNLADYETLTPRNTCHDTYTDTTESAYSAASGDGGSSDEPAP
jgi:transposase